MRPAGPEGNSPVRQGGEPNPHPFLIEVGRADRACRTFGARTDSHGMVLTGGGRYLWVGNRGDRDNVAVIDTATDAVVGIFDGFGAASDIMVLSPWG